MKKDDLNINEKCEEALDKLNENVGDEGFGPSDFEALVSGYPECEKNLRDAYKLWLDMGQLEVPPVPPRSRERFLSMLGEFEEGQGTAGTGTRRVTYTILKWAAVFIIGLSVGVFVSNRNVPNKGANSGTAANRVLQSLDIEKSATEKLKVLQTIKANTDPEEYIYEALYKTILGDPSVNVRLSAIEAMLHFSDKPKVRTLLIKALTYQESPIVQLSLAEVIIKLQENGPEEEIRKLLNSDQLHLEVKMHLKETLSQI